MNLLAPQHSFHAFTNGPAYRTRRPGEVNVIDFSSFTQLRAQFASRNFSIKYVASGTELYNLGGKDYAIGKGRYLLTNAFSRGRVVIDSSEYVHGICIELSPELVSEVAATYHNPSTPYPGKDFYNFLTSADFFEHNYSARYTNLGRYLEHAAPLLQTNMPAAELYLGQFFYGLAENMITDQQEVCRHLCAIGRVKGSTRKDLLARLLKGKELMDDAYTDKITISEIARVAAMSEYYFLRLFTNTFNCSPHKYLVEKRLQKAAAMLHSQQESIVNIAWHCGFADIHTFSKAFKKRFGRNPSAVRQSGEG